MLYGFFTTRVAALAVPLLALGVGASRANEVELPCPQVQVTRHTPEQPCAGHCLYTGPTLSSPVPCPKYPANAAPPIEMRMRLRMTTDGTFTGFTPPEAIGGYAENWTERMRVTGPGFSSLQSTVRAPDCGAPIFRQSQITCHQGPFQVFTEVPITSGSWGLYIGSGTVPLSLADDFSSEVAVSGTVFLNQYFDTSSTADIALVIDTCPADLDGDRAVGLADLVTLLSHFDTSDGATYGMGDLDGDGDVDLSDLATLLSNFGSSC